MKEEKGKNIIIIILLLIIVLLVVFITLLLTNKINLDKDIKNNDITNNQQNITKEESKEENQVTKNWTEEVMSYHLLDVEITKVRSKDLGDKEDINKTISIDMKELKELLSSLADKKITKVYSMGMGGPERDLLQISYEKNDNKYELKILNGKIYLDESDEELQNFFNQQNYEEKNKEYKEKEGTFYYYELDSYSSEIYDKYFK